MRGLRWLCALLLWHGPANAQPVAAEARAAVIAPPAAAAQERAGPSWLMVDRPRIRGGAGLDLWLGDLTRLHLDVVPARDLSVRGWRWKQRLGGASGSRAAWSFGAGFDVVRSLPDEPLDAVRERHPYRDRRIVLSPQLLIDLDRLRWLDGSAELRLQHAYWRGPDDLADDERALQVELRWRFY
jgi:hypothetical protein